MTARRWSEDVRLRSGIANHLHFAARDGPGRRIVAEIAIKAVGAEDAVRLKAHNLTVEGAERRREVHCPKLRWSYPPHQDESLWACRFRKGYGGSGRSEKQSRTHLAACRNLFPRPRGPRSRPRLTRDDRSNACCRSSTTTKPASPAEVVQALGGRGQCLKPNAMAPEARGSFRVEPGPSPSSVATPR